MDKSNSGTSKIELTPLGIPRSLRPFFQEYDIDALDPERAAFTIMGRTLAYGNRQELRWLFQRYSRERIRAWVQESGWWLLPKRRFNFWVTFFDLPDYQSNPRGRLWEH